MQLSQGAHSEWYTPKVYVEAARSVYDGVIDCDPYSCDEANKTVQAREYGTKENPLEMWHGSIFINPPYSDYRGQADEIMGKLLEYFEFQYIDEAIALVQQSILYQPSVQKILRLGSICLVNHRIRYWDGIKGEIKRSPQQNNAFLYMGPHRLEFEREFKEFGSVLHSMDW